MDRIGKDQYYLKQAQNENKYQVIGNNSKNIAYFSSYSYEIMLSIAKFIPTNSEKTKIKAESLKDNKNESNAGLYNENELGQKSKAKQSSSISYSKMSSKSKISLSKRQRCLQFIKTKKGEQRCKTKALKSSKYCNCHKQLHDSNEFVATKESILENNNNSNIAN
ncbi:hypothetical protein CONCODRAFT_6004 [Conidiobolus coronatus NRRL 28638]|uniref:Uncharacterized protein n=1 Tax=Conidiobolus coronatus (strain ATCC 28846 / CBS 209.66 / NRRL 28638) TaxID=796925 RepID=A0A137P8J7_CONC2|nr:hypothetical protein CONCODRAFT_6004 [Conidiobolus coronatus NRRL 28638]|eukprot:KXN71274.1 hypothetical protein CONCODRAFT_6004 [Conidiobolus coronatus NRRL 28638]